MTHDRATTSAQLDALWRCGARTNVRDVELVPDTKLAIVSDLHMGDGSWSDDLRRNTEAVRSALRWYRDKGYTVVLLGDVEDLWKFDLPAVRRCYDETIYRDMALLGPGPTCPRRIRVFGNHDNDWRGLDDPAAGRRTGPPPGVPEAVRLRRGGQSVALLIHGHQGSLDSDKGAWFSRFFVRIWRWIEPIFHLFGWYPTNPAATECKVMDDFERSMYDWAKHARAILVCGHSHRAYFGSRSRADVIHEEIATAIAAGKGDKATVARRKELRDERRKGRDIGPLDANGQIVPCYFNSGCGLYTTGITAIEIEGAGDGEIRLVFWKVGSSAPEVWRYDRLGLVSAGGLLSDVQRGAARVVEAGV
jgi:predicted phosphodiesterase